MKSTAKNTITSIVIFVCLLNIKSYAMQQANACPYLGDRFKSVVRDSYKYMKSGKSDEFYHWMENSYKNHYKKLPDAENTSLNLYLKKEKVYLAAIKNKTERKSHWRSDICS